MKNKIKDEVKEYILEHYTPSTSKGSFFGRAIEHTIDLTLQKERARVLGIIDNYINKGIKTKKESKNSVHPHIDGALMILEDLKKRIGEEE
jgi:hypothetical protein